MRCVAKRSPGRPTIGTLIDLTVGAAFDAVRDVRPRIRRGADRQCVRWPRIDTQRARVPMQHALPDVSPRLTAIVGGKHPGDALFIRYLGEFANAPETG